MPNKNIKQDKNESELSRRKFIKIGAATLTISIVSGGILKLILPKQGKMGSINASNERPNKNPAFSFKSKQNGTLVCFTNLQNGKILKHELNSVGAELYLVCDGKRTRKKIIEKAAFKLKEDIKTFTPKAKQFLDELEKQNLIVTTGKVNLFYRTVVRNEKA